MDDRVRFSFDEGSGAFADSLDLDFLSGVVRETLSRVGFAGSVVSVAFVAPDGMAELNSRFRGISGPTDVLSFENPSFDFHGSGPSCDSGGEGGYIGDICVCLDEVRANAESFGEKYGTEIIRVLVHGALHLCGFDHGDMHVGEGGGLEGCEMLEMQERMVREFASGV